MQLCNSNKQRYTHKKHFHYCHRSLHTHTHIRKLYKKGKYLKNRYCKTLNFVEVEIMDRLALANIFDR